MKHPEQQTMTPIRRVVGRVEQFFKRLITGGDRFNAFCDSRLNLCYYCSLLRIKARRQHPPFFIIFTRDFIYTFLRFPNSPRITIVTRRASFWQLTSLQVANDQMCARTT